MSSSSSLPSGADLSPLAIRNIENSDRGEARATLHTLESRYHPGDAASPKLDSVDGSNNNNSSSSAAAQAARLADTADCHPRALRDAENSNSKELRDQLHAMEHK
ncbi:hypothetical protein RI367_005339 [Sorochytrium milnesiophthora]